jgi:Flp pilus assembly pilin Flp
MMAPRKKFRLNWLEYLIIIVLVVLVVIALLVLMGPQTGDIFTTITNGL